MQHYPQRIVCLTEETTETLYLLEEDWRIVGISGFTVRPAKARKEKPKVSAFTSAKIDKILALEPDLVLGFSDLQADIAAALVKQGIAVHVFNHRSVKEIFQMIAMLGGMIGCETKARALMEKLRSGLQNIENQSQQFRQRPKVFFEEWDDPLFSGIQWVSELVSLAGGDDVFPELAKESLGKNRIIADPTEVIQRQPDIIIGSWCGKKFRPEHVRARPGWASIPAVVNNDIYEIKSAHILQPGPAALTDGVQQLFDLFSAWQVHKD
ncbi:MAG: cobalamin-binding protein [Gammaproteobacteria bacterium]|nr:cobalamin-binding protein [Gammaproteobacteria bacterium]NNC97610.1 cobalamin-binding protein [Gammaproteobacteria bacterium]NNM14204.1 cobalamin-binding protein [Gammaproteobacteria bacterium]